MKEGGANKKKIAVTGGQIIFDIAGYRP